MTPAQRYAWRVYLATRPPLPPPVLLYTRITGT